MNTYDKLRYDQLPWSEKYKPKSISDLFLNVDIKKKLNMFVETKTIPNMILTGPSGVGKTSTIYALIKDLYGKYYKSAVLEINSFDGSIKSLSDDVSNFCRSRLSVKTEDIGKYPIHKIVIFEGADNIDKRTQPQLNIYMETFKNTKFIFTCNTSSNIIESIHSRCLTILYSLLDKDHIYNNLIKIATNEKITFDDSAVKKIAEISDGDMRHGINSLQLIFNKNNEITLKEVNELCDYPQQIMVKELFINLIKKDLRSAIVVLNTLKHKGYSNSDILISFLTTLKSDICRDFKDDTKICIYNSVANASFRVSKGIDSKLQILSCLTDIITKL